MYRIGRKRCVEAGREASLDQHLAKVKDVKVCKSQRRWRWNWRDWLWTALRRLRCIYELRTIGPCMWGGAILSFNACNRGRLASVEHRLPLLNGNGSRLQTTLGPWRDIALSSGPSAMLADQRLAATPREHHLPVSGGLATGGAP